MRILGLIAIYAVSLFLTGWISLHRGYRELFYSVNSQFKEGSNPECEDILHFPHSQKLTSNDSVELRSNWLFIPIGVVRYPDFLKFDLLNHGK